MLAISNTLEWGTTYPDACLGLLELSDVRNDLPAPQLDVLKRDIVTRLRARYASFTRKDFLALPVMAAYEQYYKRFQKTYHVLLQLESIVLKGKDLPSVSPLVDANFAAEVETLVLTAGHDADKLQDPVLIDVSCAGDEMTLMNGVTRPIREGDMVMRDSHGISCSIIYGQDNLSLITPATTHVLYVAYAPAGVSAGAVEAQLRQIEQNVRLFAPRVKVEQSHLLRAQGVEG
jgi:DNA/RNA-binding domain of Phe-tRNA-synthetase-like protein